MLQNGRNVNFYTAMCSYPIEKDGAVFALQRHWQLDLSRISRIDDYT